MTTAVFMTFAGNCNEALSFYQQCFGGRLQIQTLKIDTSQPLLIGSLISDTITMHGSDLVHDEGRIPGNHVAVLLQCDSMEGRKALLKKVQPNHNISDDGISMIEIVDRFEMRWMLSV